MCVILQALCQNIGPHTGGLGGQQSLYRGVKVRSEMIYIKIYKHEDLLKLSC